LLDASAVMRALAFLTMLGACTSSPAGLPPGTIAVGLARPTAVAIDDTSIYWITTGTDADNDQDAAVMKANLDGTDVVTLVSPVDLPTALAVDAGHIYWATNGTNQPAYLMKAGLDGSDVTAILTLTESATEMAIDATSLYWTNVFAGTVNKVGLDGTGMTVLASGQEGADWLAVDATSVYWIVEGINGAPGSIAKSSLAGANLTTVVSGQLGIDGLAIDSTHVFWGTSDSETTSSIYAAALDGSGVQTIATGSFVDPWSIVTGNGAVYWAALGTGDIVDGSTIADGGVMRGNLDGSAPTVLAPGQPNAHGIAVNATHVFWATEGTNEGAYKDGTIQSAAL
jgi:hypothetical protein